MAVLILHEIYSNLVSFEQLTSYSAAGGLYLAQYLHWKPSSKNPGYAPGF